MESVEKTMQQKQKAHVEILTKAGASRTCDHTGCHVDKATWDEGSEALLAAVF